MAKIPKKKAIHVVLDTNCLFTEQEDKLICQSLRELIEETKNNTDLEVFWYLPFIVIAERKYQMIKKAMGLLIPLRKLEKLLGHNLNINETVIVERVNAVIKREMDIYTLFQLELDKAQLDLDLLIKSARDRLPPFDKEKEKGLRDFLILEAYWQLSEKMPKSSSVCRLILITNDDLLQEAFISRMSDRVNAKTVSDLDGLKSYINVLTSTVKEELIKGILPTVTSVFFQPENKNSLYYSREIGKKISVKFNQILTQGHSSEWEAIVLKLTIGTPTFLSKNKQKIQWSSKINYLIEATKKNVSHSELFQSASNQSAFNNTITGNNLFGLNCMNIPQATPSLLGVTSLFSQHQQRVLPEPIGIEKQKGEHIFEVLWEITLTTHSKLINPKITEIKHFDTVWSKI